MQETCERVIPKIVCTRPSFTEIYNICDEDCEKKRQKRVSRSRVRRNSRRLSINSIVDRRSSSSSRSPSPAKLTSWDYCKSSQDEPSSNDVLDNCNCSGYKQYLQLLEVPQTNVNIEWGGETSGDDLSSEWDSDPPAKNNDLNQRNCVPLKTSGWRKLRNIVHWTPFFQTYKKQRYPWVQLSGHQGNFQAGPTPGTILKRLCPQELSCFQLLMNDVLRPYVPEFRGVRHLRMFEGNKIIVGENETETRGQVVPYLELQDLLCDFNEPCVMDCKIGVRTYLESELAKAKERPKLRKDMYEKMIQVDPTAPTAEERNLKGVTKPRYMVWRETISSTATLGFRVEGMKTAHGGSVKDFKTTRSEEQVKEVLQEFFHGYPHVVPRYLQRLRAIKATLMASPFFKTHEIIGSSLLFVHDSKEASIWLIDFAKTLPVPSHLQLSHDVDWKVGNHEDGYLIGIKNIINILEDMLVKD